MLNALCALLPIIVQAITVECNNFHPYPIGMEVRDYFYKVTLGAGEEIDFFQVANLVPVTDFIVLDGSGTDLGWSNGTGGTEPYTNGFAEHGSVVADNRITPNSVTWFNSTSIGEGVYYFGYNGPSSMVEGGFLAGNDANTLNEDWSASVGNGLGPVHIPIPEPSTIFLLLSGSAIIGIVRRKVLR